MPTTTNESGYITHLDLEGGELELVGRIVGVNWKEHCPERDPENEALARRLPTRIVELIKGVFYSGDFGMEHLTEPSEYSKGLRKMHSCQTDAWKFLHRLGTGVGVAYETKHHPEGWS